MTRLFQEEDILEGIVLSSEVTSSQDEDPLANPAFIPDINKGKEKYTRKRKYLTKTNLTARTYQRDIHPFDIILDIASGDRAALGLAPGEKIDTKVRLEAAKAAMEYLAPKQKPIEEVQEENSPKLIAPPRVDRRGNLALEAAKQQIQLESEGYDPDEMVEESNLEDF